MRLDSTGRVLSQITDRYSGVIIRTLQEELLQCEDCSTRYVHSVELDEGGSIMSEIIQPAQQAEGDLAAKVDRTELLEKLRRLEERRRDVSEIKKAASVDYNEQLRDIDGEISDTLILLKDKEVVSSDA